MKRKSSILFPIGLIVIFFLAKILISGAYLKFSKLENVAMAKSTKVSQPPAIPVDLNEELKQKEKELRKKEKELARKQKEYEALKQDVDARIAELNEIQQKLTAYAKKLAEREKALKDAKMAHLVSLYTAMDPQKAAAIMDKLDMRTVVKILGNMKGKSAGKILAMMDPEKGAKISQALSRNR